MSITEKDTQITLCFELAKTYTQGNETFTEAREKRTLSSTLGAPAQPEGWR